MSIHLLCNNITVYCLVEGPPRSANTRQHTPRGLTHVTEHRGHAVGVHAGYHRTAYGAHGEYVHGTSRPGPHNDDAPAPLRCFVEHYKISSITTCDNKNTATATTRRIDSSQTPPCCSGVFALHRVRAPAHSTPATCFSASPCLRGAHLRRHHPTTRKQPTSNGTSRSYLESKRNSVRRSPSHSLPYFVSTDRTDSNVHWT